MKSSFILGLCLYLPFSTQTLCASAEAVAPISVAELASKISQVDEKMKIIRSAEPGVTVIAFGASGSGKSSVITSLMGRPLVARAHAMGRLLETDAPLTDIVISHGAAVGTRFPTLCRDEATGTNYIDVPGIEDPRGGIEDTVGAYTLKQGLSSENLVKVLFVASEEAFSREGKFLSSLLRLTQIFENLEELKACLSIVVTKQDRVDPARIFSTLLEIPQASNAFLQVPRVREILEFLHSNQNSRLCVFPYPSTVGEYSAAPADRLRTQLETIPGVVNPRIKLSLNDAAVVALLQLSEQLNSNIQTELSEVSRQAANQAWALIRAKAKPARQRKLEFRSIASALVALPVASCEEFFAALTVQLEALGLADASAMLDASRQHAISVRYLEALSSESAPSVGDWHTALMPLSVRLNRFADASESVATRLGRNIRTYSEEHLAGKSKNFFGSVTRHYSTVSFAIKAEEEKVTTFFSDEHGDVCTVEDSWTENGRSSTVRI